jgi:pimeloyl-ACP methyl ester carboxylesterase
VEIHLGRFPAQLERPQPVKFAWPIVLIPELFTTARHLTVLLGYLATVGWEVYAPDLRAAAGRADVPGLGRLRFSDLSALIDEALLALGRDAIMLGFGMGGLLALKAAERPGVKAAVAFAPMVPGFRSSLFMRARNRAALWMRRPLKPPAGRTRFAMVADAEPFQREGAIKALVPDCSRAPFEVALGRVQFSSVKQPAPPRLIVVGDSDPFVPHDRATSLANSIGAQLITLRGRGHWIIGGRALERAIEETQRFLVRSLGQDLLLLYSEELKEDPDDEH